MPSFEETCESGSSDLKKTCEAGLTCQNSKCACPGSTLVWRDNSCQNRTYGDSCSSNSQCDTGFYSAKGEGGAVCSSERCDCGSGYDKVDSLYVKADGSEETFSLCLKGLFC